MTRLPTPGSDSGTWGETLNEFLQVGHDSAGNNIGKVVEASKSGAYTLTAAENGKRIIRTGDRAMFLSLIDRSVATALPWS